MAIAKKTKNADTAPRRTPVLLRPFVPIGRYFAGAWYELNQVRWPDRGATWSLTIAVLIFTAFFSIVILALDYVFQYLFKEILL